MSKTLYVVRYSKQWQSASLNAAPPLWKGIRVVDDLHPANKNDLIETVVIDMDKLKPTDKRYFNERCTPILSTSNKDDYQKNYNEWKENLKSCIISCESNVE